jgi:hypothetical protein
MFEHAGRTAPIGRRLEDYIAVSCKLGQKALREQLGVIAAPKRMNGTVRDAVTGK